MTRAEALREIDEILELDPGTLTGAETLKGLDGWDSLATLGFIAMADEKANKQVSGSQIQKCETINDLVGLLGAN